MTTEKISLLTHLFEDHAKMGIDFMPAWRKMLEEDINVEFFKNGSTIAIWEVEEHMGEPGAKVWYARGDLQKLYDLFKDLTWLYFERNLYPHKGQGIWFHKKHLKKYERLIRQTQNAKRTSGSASSGGSQYPRPDSAIEVEREYEKLYRHGGSALHQPQENNSSSVG